jgi:2-oxoglutarate dehydrogenase E2 component (dihydrolipoamide succinyltransferase)
MWREKHKEEFQKKYNQKLTYTPFFVEAVAKTILEFPLINSSVDGTNIILKKSINIGMATALPSGNLIVPVIKHANELSFIEIASKVNELAKNARESKLHPDDIQDGTFTITNLGQFKNLAGTPIINQPQVAILAFGSIEKKPSVIETPSGDAIAIRHKLILSLSYDHRIIDGALGGEFLYKTSYTLENFDISRLV